MATQRFISTSFWGDKWVRSLDPSEKYLYMYLLTNSLTNIAGVYQITIDRIAFDTGHDERTLRPIIQKFEKEKKAFFYSDEWIILPTWPKHQKWEKRPGVKAGIEAIIAALPDEIINVLLKTKYAFPITRGGVQPPKNPRSTPQEPRYSDSDSDSEFDSDPDIDLSVAGQNPRPSPVADEPDSIFPDEDPEDPPEVEPTPEMKAAVELSALLLSEHRKTDPKFLAAKDDRKTASRWAEDVEKLIRIDGRPEAEIREVVLWVKTPGNFWLPNIESGKKLREKYPTLLAQMQREKFQQPRAAPGPRDFANELVASRTKRAREIFGKEAAI